MAATASQAKFLNAVLSGHNVVLLGKAGTGKTYILKKAIAMLKNTKKVEVTTPQHEYLQPSSRRQGHCTHFLGFGQDIYVTRKQW